MASSFDELRQLQKLPIPGAPATVPLNMGGGGMQPLPLPQMPAVVAAPPAPTPVSNSTNQLMHAQGELSRLQTTGSGVDQIKNPFLRGLAKVGTGIESALLPGFAQQTPGTELHHQMLMGQQQGYINEAQKNLQSEAQQAQTQALTDYTQQRPDIEQSKIDQRQMAVQDRVGQAAAARGQKVSWDENGLPTFADDTQSEEYFNHQAIAKMHQSTAEKNAIMADIAKNHYVPGTKEYEEAQKKISQKDQEIHNTSQAISARMMGLGLRAENQAAMLHGTDTQGNAIAGAAQIEDDNGGLHTVGTKFAPTAIKQNAKVVTFKDLAGSVAHSKTALQGIDLSDPKIVAAMQDPTSTVGKVVNGKLIQPSLTPAQITGINAIRQLHEQAGILRQSTGGTGAEAQAQRILETLPKAGDSPAMAASKLAEIEQVMGRLTPSVTRVAGGATPPTTGRASAPKEGDTKVNSHGDAVKFSGGKWGPA